MNYTETLFHKMQSRLRCQGGKAKAVRGATAVRPAFSSIYTGDEHKSDRLRLIEYRAKRLRIVGQQAVTEKDRREAYEAQGLRVREHAGRLEILNNDDQVVATDYGRDAA